MRIFTNAKRAATMPSSPAFGVCAWTMAGRYRRMSRHNRHTAGRSLSGLICRFISTA